MFKGLIELIHVLFVQFGFGLLRDETGVEAFGGGDEDGDVFVGIWVLCDGCVPFVVGYLGWFGWVGW